MEKICTKCGLPKPLKMFGKLKSGKNGVHPWRKDCCRQYNSKYYKENRDQILETHVEYYLENRELKLKYQKAYREAHLEEVSRYGRTWFINNRVRAGAYGKEYRERQKANEGFLSIVEWEALKEKYGHRCLCCGEQKKLSPDHIIPTILRGSNSVWNRQPLCKSCNSKKGTRIIDFRTTPPTFIS